MWEEEYYIFDSNTISESDFEEKLEYQDYKAFEDSMMGDEVVNRLNEQHETIQKLEEEYSSLQKSASHIDTIARADRNYAERLYEEKQQYKEKVKDTLQAFIRGIEDEKGIDKDNEQFQKSMDCALKYLKRLSEELGIDLSSSEYDDFWIRKKEKARESNVFKIKCDAIINRKTW